MVKSKEAVESKGCPRFAEGLGGPGAGGWEGKESVRKAFLGPALMKLSVG